MATGALSAVESVEQFNELLKSHSDDSRLLVLHFDAPWAPQCQQINDVLTDLSTTDKQLSSVTFIKIEAEKLPELSLKYDITAVPTCVLIKKQAVVDRVNGVDIPELTKKIRQHAPPPLSPPTLSKLQGSSTTSDASKNSQNKPSATDRLKSLTNQAPVMIFIKGSPAQPKCGFSKTLVQILADEKVSYKSFDILTDEEVRQGLKVLSNWPTFPQVYVNGDLIGGLDIVKELVESGEFHAMLPKEESLEERLKKLVRRDRVMLFMKGSPVAPQCGFSRTITGILQELGIEYGHFDILQDEEVRNGLKTFSNWPTFPQLYVNGELIGGLDIVKELREAGELESVLKQN